MTYVPVQLCPSVAVDDDTVCDVWASDVLPIGKRLLFVAEQQRGGSYTARYIGQVDDDFDLGPQAAPVLPEVAADGTPVHF